MNHKAWIMRERVEDLGRLSVILHNLLDHALFDEANLPRRCKDWPEWWEAMSEENKHDWIHETIYRLEDVQEKILIAKEIANGQDLLNEPEL